MQMAKKATKYTDFVKLLKNLGDEQNKCSAKIVENSSVWQIFYALCIIILNTLIRKGVANEPLQRIYRGN